LFRRDLPPFINFCERGSQECAVELDQYPGCLFYIEFVYYFCGPDDYYVGEYYFVKPITCPKYLEEYNIAIATNTLPAFEFNFSVAMWSEINNFLVLKFKNIV
jgi:hypothetical protein